jgi:hypothetical protein
MGGLVKDDFGVVDGVGSAAPIRALIPEYEPTSIGIIIDAGPGTEAIAPTVINAVSKLLEALRPEDEIFIAQYSGTTQFLSDFGADRIALAAAMSGYAPGEGRAMRDAIATGLIRMRSAQHEKKALIVIADGDDEGSQTTDDDPHSSATRGRGSARSDHDRQGTALAAHVCGHRERARRRRRGHCRRGDSPNGSSHR